MADGKIRIGIGGWTYAPWRGLFYPDNLPQRQELEYASSHLTAIEINATFYGRQSEKSWKSWAAVVPDGFQFTVKGSRFCVSRSRLADTGDGIANFFAQGLTALGPKLGPVLWMLSAHRRFDYDDIASFFELLPRERDRLRLRHAIEPRHESFNDEKFFVLCREHNVAVVFSESREFPCIKADTADFTYARLQGMREEIPTGYDEASLASLAEHAKGSASGGRDVYVFMINGAKVRAPAAAVALRTLIGC